MGDGANDLPMIETADRLPLWPSQSSLSEPLHRIEKRDLVLVFEI